MNTKRVLGTLTIGQSPRVDLVPELKAMLGDDVEVIEEGALDGLTLDDVKRFYPAPGDYVLVTRMADGTAVKIAEKHILPRMQEGLARLVDRGAEIIALVCTGEFPHFDCDRLVIRPQGVLYNVTSAVAADSRLGVIIPDNDQVPQGVNRWSEAAAGVQVVAASPYGEVQAVEQAAHALKAWGARIVVMDCIGYTLAMKDRVRDITGAPVILARSILARVLRELL